MHVHQLLTEIMTTYRPGDCPMAQTITVAATSDLAASTAPCPKCASTMVLAAITPHPVAIHMQRHTFLCATCNQTKTYMLPAK